MENKANEYETRDTLISPETPLDPKVVIKGVRPDDAVSGEDVVLPYDNDLIEKIIDSRIEGKKEDAPLWIATLLTTTESELMELADSADSEVYKKVKTIIAGREGLEKKYIKVLADGLLFNYKKLKALLDTVNTDLDDARAAKNTAIEKEKEAHREKNRLEQEKNRIEKENRTLTGELGDSQKREEHLEKEAANDYKRNTLEVLTQIAKGAGDKLIDLSRFAADYSKSEDKSQKIFGLTIRGLIDDMKNAGIRIMGEAGEEVPFDPGEHKPAGEKIARGEAVVIETPGLVVDDNDGQVEVITKALVMKRKV